MPQLIDYLIKLSGTLMILYLFYWIVLRRLTFYTLNRWYLLGYSTAAIFLPFININPLLETVQLSNDPFIQWVPAINAEDLNRTSSTVDSNHFWRTENIVLALFVTGIVFMAIRFMIRYFSVRSVRHGSRLISDGAVRVYHSDKNIIPFSFGRSIFINKYKHSEDDLRDIIKHEFIHVKQNHTVDILWGEWLCILNWYNPFAWLIRNAIRQNLEFIADNKVLQNGVDRKQYQYLLLKVVGVQQYGITTSFNFTSLQKRIAMMNKMRSAKLHLVKFLFILPLLAVILLAFRNDVKSRAILTNETSGVISKDHLLNESLISDTVPLPKKSTASSRPTFKPNSKGYIITIADNYGECIVIVRDKQNKIVKAVSLVEWDELEKENADRYGEIPPPPSSAEPSVPPVPAEAPKMPGNVSSIHVKDKKLTLVTKNGQTEVYDLDRPEQKAGFEKKYNINVRESSPNPEAASNRVNNSNARIIADPTENVDEKKSSENDPKDLLPAGVVLSKQSANNGEARGFDFLKFPADFNGLILINDKEYDKKTFEKEVRLNSADVKSIDVFKGDAAHRSYGEKGKNGVIRIFTK